MGSPPSSQLVVAPLRATDPARTQLLVSVSVSAASLGAEPVLSYSFENNLGHSPVYGPIQVAVHGPGGWIIESIPGESGAGPCVAVDASARIHVAYSTLTQLRYAVRTSGVWQAETMGPASSQFSLAVAPGGSLQLAYGQSGSTRYAMRGPTAWSSESVAGAGTGPGTHALAIDPGGRPRILYQLSTPQGGELNYARRDGSGWVSERVDSAGDTGYSSSIALDPLGRPWLSYHRYDLDCMMAAQDPSTAGVTLDSLQSPGALSILSANPLPIGRPLKLALALATPDVVRLELFDVSGRRVAAWPRSGLSAGRHEWDLRLDPSTPGLRLVRAIGANGVIGAGRFTLVR